MQLIRLALVLGVLCGFAPLAGAAEDTQPEPEPSCEPDGDESCASEEEKNETEEGGDDEALDRGFDPCLINASLPACQSDEDGEGSAAAEETPPGSEEGQPEDDSDNPSGN
jgi:hypothetical protein